MIYVILILAIFAYLYWQLDRTNTDIRPQETYVPDDCDWNGKPID